MSEHWEHRTVERLIPQRGQFAMAKFYKPEPAAVGRNPINRSLHLISLPWRTSRQTGSRCDGLVCRRGGREEQRAQRIKAQHPCGYNFGTSNGCGRLPEILVICWTVGARKEKDGGRTLTRFKITAEPFKTTRDDCHHPGIII